MITLEQVNLILSLKGAEPSAILDVVNSLHIKDEKLPSKEGHIYTLALMDDKYYVGFSNNVDKRITDHFAGNGAEWTKRHPPNKVLSVIKVVTCPKKEEREATLACMRKFGWENVRGYAWSQWNMSKPPKDL